MRLLLDPGQGVILCSPAFGMYRFFARLNHRPIWSVSLSDDFSVDAAAIERLVQNAGVDKPRLLFLTSPGNPDGQIVPVELVERLLSLPLMVVVDEAYIEFGGPTVLPLLSEHENLIVLRTLSKWAALAGLRLGYAVLSAELAGYLDRIRAPYNVNAAAMVAALATFADLATTRGRVDQLIVERERLQHAFEGIAWLEPIPSQANFILCRVQGERGATVAGALARRGILIRSFRDHRLNNYVRISVGRPEQNLALVRALRGLTWP